MSNQISRRKLVLGAGAIAISGTASGTAPAANGAAKTETQVAQSVRAYNLVINYLIHKHQGDGQNHPDDKISKSQLKDWIDNAPQELAYPTPATPYPHDGAWNALRTECFDAATSWSTLNMFVPVQEGPAPGMHQEVTVRSVAPAADRDAIQPDDRPKIEGHTLTSAQKKVMKQAVDSVQHDHFEP